MAIVGHAGKKSTLRYYIFGTGPSAMSLALIAKQQPSVINDLIKLKHEVFKEGALSTKQKALMAVSVSCLLKCDTCLMTWGNQAKELGATTDEIREAMLVAMYLAGPSSVVWSPKIDELLGSNGD
jgi:AhpD family alkylhydroperoxidase